MLIGYRTEILKAFTISVRWPIYTINSVDKTKFLYTTSPPTQHHSFFRNYPFIHIGGRRVLTPLRHIPASLQPQMCDSCYLYIAEFQKVGNLAIYKSQI